MIEERKEFVVENVLSFKATMLQTEMNNELTEIGKFIEEHGIKKNGPLITTTFGVEQDNENNQLLDVEIMVPVNSDVCYSDKYRLKDKFALRNAVYTRYIGNPSSGLQDYVVKMLEYIKTNRLQQVTSVYIMQVNDISHISEIDKLINDIYIGVADNIL